MQFLNTFIGKLQVNSCCVAQPTFSDFQNEDDGDDDNDRVFSHDITAAVFVS